MEIMIVKEPITKDQLEEIARAGFGDMVKAAVDIEQGIMAIGGELHMDELEELLEKEKSNHQNIWGINLYVGETGSEFIEFDSMVNLKPAFGNRTRGVDDPAIKEKIIAIVDMLIK